MFDCIPVEGTFGFHFPPQSVRNTLQDIIHNSSPRVKLIINIIDIINIIKIIVCQEECEKKLKLRVGKKVWRSVQPIRDS